MIVLTKEEIIIFTPFKAGSTSLHHALCDKPGAMWVVGGDDLCQHISDIPESFEFIRCPLKILVVRNPYDRFMSMYSQHVSWAGWNDKEPATIDEFLDGVVNVGQPLFAPLSKMYRNWNQYWWLERIQECLDELDIGVDVGRKNVTIDPMVPLDSSQLKRLQPWAEPDCTAFGYPLKS